jgi:ABC-2 type transport system ATP-binding protein
VVTLTNPDPAAVAALQPLVDGSVHVADDGRRLSATVTSTAGLGTEAVRALDRAGILVDDVAVVPPSLDDVFFVLTGHPSEQSDNDTPEAISA